MKSWLRWQWNALRYKLRFTSLTPADHEFRRAMQSRDTKEQK